MTMLQHAVAVGPADARRDVPTRGRSGVLVIFREPVRYSVAWTLQKQWHADRLSGARLDTLLVLQHSPVYTVGRGTRAAHLNPQGTFSQAAIPVEPVNRGGSVTYHGPGQLVAYPILFLSQYAPGAKAYVRMLEEVIMRTLLYWGVHGYRETKMPGVWVEGRQGPAKVASIGARIDRGITLHGFALNVVNDLRPFSSIVPCGIDGCRMTSLAEMAEAPISLPAVAERLASEFAAVFGVTWVVRSADDARRTT
jgi:lipoyl(octanoyl) transferase